MLIYVIFMFYVVDMLAMNLDIRDGGSSNCDDYTWMASTWHYFSAWFCVAGTWTHTPYFTPDVLIISWSLYTMRARI